MNKDAFLATLIGFAIGLLITGGILIGPNILKYVPKLTIPQGLLTRQIPKNMSPTPTQPSKSFSIDSPLPDAIVEKDTLLVSGTAPKSSVVFIMGPLDEAAQKVDTDGKYAGTITLTEGKNDVIVKNFVNGKPTTMTVTVFYTPETL